MIVVERSCDDARAVVAIGANGVGVDEDVLDGLLSGDGESDGEEGVHCSNTSNTNVDARVRSCQAARLG